MNNKPMVERRCRSRPLTRTPQSKQRGVDRRGGWYARADQPRPPRRPAHQAGPDATRPRPLAPRGRTPPRDGLGRGGAAAPRRRCCTGTEHHTAFVSRRRRHCTEQAQKRHLRDSNSRPLDETAQAQRMIWGRTRSPWLRSKPASAGKRSTYAAWSAKSRGCSCSSNAARPRLPPKHRA